ncbi:hypothetical protein EYF80_044096 [Liparis tanakae]|uniref:Uncharacterized protein n=1 Tax=Liparis tanakae TaxID=230148 RepID=A0A4Z2FXU4_9TELE|nr:hypothetical protein EYF80_044096 [Liparis tanakae]
MLCSPCRHPKESLGVPQPPIGCTGQASRGPWLTFNKQQRNRKGEGNILPTSSCFRLQCLLMPYQDVFSSVGIPSGNPGGSRRVSGSRLTSSLGASMPTCQGKGEDR